MHIFCIKYFINFSPIVYIALYICAYSPVSEHSVGKKDSSDQCQGEELGETK